MQNIFETITDDVFCLILKENKDDAGWFFEEFYCFTLSVRVRGIFVTNILMLICQFEKTDVEKGNSKELTQDRYEKKERSIPLKMEISLCLFFSDT